MSPDDPRHGSEAGYEQHLRDGEEACDDCTEADLVAARRRSKRRTMGHQFTRPVGTKIHARLVELRDRGARIDDIAEWSGIQTSQVCRILEGGPEGRVYARTWLALHDMTPGHILTDVGIQRRLQALAWVGWSPALIAKRAGVCEDTINHARNRGTHLNAGYRRRIADLYGELSMTQPPMETVVQRRAVGNVRSWARRRGFAAPLAWDDETIDDPATRPRGRRTGLTRNRRPAEVDQVIVDRLLAGQQVEHSTRAERDEAMRRWKAAGKSEKSLCEIHGWRDSRYGKAAA